jgi:hypothetical protein
MQNLGNDDWGTSGATMRVLVADQETEMLEAISRTFEVDVATSKATCIDLLRANDFDVLVACERLTDGSGLELLSHVGQRWPNVIRILAIEPARRAMLKGRLGPFKLFEIIPYPIDDERLEAALTHAAEALAQAEPTDAPGATAASRPGISANTPGATAASKPGIGANTPGATAGSRPDVGASTPGATATSRSGIGASTTGATRAAASYSSSTTPASLGTKDDARRPGGRTSPVSSAPAARDVPPLQQRQPAPQLAGKHSAPPPAHRSIPPSQKPLARGPAAPTYPPLPAKGSKIVPLGSTAASDFRILPHDYRQQNPSAARQRRGDDDEKKSPTLHEKAAALAAGALSAVARYIKPEKSEPPQSPKAPPRKKR